MSNRGPVKLAQLAAAGSMWHRHDVTQAKGTLVRTYTPEETVEAMPLAWESVKGCRSAKMAD